MKNFLRLALFLSFHHWIFEKNEVLLLNQNSSFYHYLLSFLGKEVVYFYKYYGNH